MTVAEIGGARMVDRPAMLCGFDGGGKGKVTIRYKAKFDNAPGAQPRFRVSIGLGALVPGERAITPAVSSINVLRPAKL